MMGINHILVSCVITGNVANTYGGGGRLYGGIDVRDCVITGNRSTNGPAGGIYGANMNLRNSLIADNMANTNGGGAYIVADSTLANCTIAGNSSAVGSGGGLYQGGSVFGTNNIVYHNTAADAPNFTNTAGNSGLDYSCVTPAVDGISNIISDPAFVSVNGGNYRLTARSPCFNTGTNQDWMTNTFDLDARARILYNYVDMGCYEYRLPPAGTLFMSH